MMHKQLLIALLFLQGLIAGAQPVYVQVSGITPAHLAHEILHDIRSKNYNKIITFLGFSSADYEDPQKIDTVLEYIFEKESLSAAYSSIVLGSTDGIFRVAQLAKKNNIPVYIISSEEAYADFKKKPADQQSPVYKYYGLPIQEFGWIDSPDGNKIISPITQALIEVADIIYMIGGGYIATAELEYALQQKKNVVYYPAKYNKSKFQQLVDAGGGLVKIPLSPYGLLFEYLTRVNPHAIGTLTILLPEQWANDIELQNFYTKYSTHHNIKFLLK